MFSTPETSVHVRDKNREISPLQTEEGYGGNDLEKRWVLRREWKTLWDTPTTDLGAESEPGDGGEHSEVAAWQGTRRDGGSLFHRWGAAYRKERLLYKARNLGVWLCICPRPNCTWRGATKFGHWWNQILPSLFIKQHMWPAAQFSGKSLCCVVW